MARSMFSAGMFTDLAPAIAVRSLGLLPGSPPPALAATVISLMYLVKTCPRLASVAPFFRLMVLHFECPDTARPRDRPRIGGAIRVSGDRPSVAQRNMTIRRERSFPAAVR